MTEFQYLDEGNSEAQDRLATSFLLAQTSPGLATTGVLSGLAVSQTTTASGSVQIAAGAAPIQASVTAGVAFMVSDTVKTLDVLTANPMGGLPRHDVVVFDSVTKSIVPIVGEPHASPTDPTVPATACALARLRHTAGATTIPSSAIDDLRVTTTLGPAQAGGAWTPYAPTLTGISLGNGTLAGYALRSGKTLEVSVVLTFGTTTTFAGGAGVPMGLSLPPGTLAAGSTARVQALSAFISDASAGVEYVSVGKVYGGTGTVFLVLNGSDVASVNAGRPMVWASGDQVAFTGRVEVA